MIDTIVLSALISLCSGSGLPANIQLDIDGDRETERIYSLFNSYMSKLEKMQGELGTAWRVVTGGGRWLWRHLAGLPGTPRAFCRDDRPWEPLWSACVFSFVG